MRFFVSFDYTGDAETEVARFFNQTGRVMVLLTVRQILDELIARRLVWAAASAAVLSKIERPRANCCRGLRGRVLRHLFGKELHNVRTDVARTRSAGQPLRNMQSLQAG
jgi:hypothetical protein